MEEKEVEVDPRAMVAGIRNLLAATETTLDLDENGGVVLVGYRLAEVSPALRKLVERNQKIIASHLSKCRQWKWAGTSGLEHTEENPSDDPHPSRARWWRWMGEPGWREVPGWVDESRKKLVIGAEE